MESSVWLVSSHLPLALSFWIYIVRLSSHWSMRPGALPTASSSTLRLLHPGDLLCSYEHPLLLSHYKCDLFTVLCKGFNICALDVLIVIHHIPIGMASDAARVGENPVRKAVTPADCTFQ